MWWRAPRERRLVDGVPGAFGVFLRRAAVEISILDLLGLPFVLVGIHACVAPGHGGSLPRPN
jgi:hypothetical protein